MFVLGITGPSGAGKSTVCALLTERGFFHIDTDRLVPETYPDAIPELIAAFGPDVVKDGTVDKKALARAAFASPERTETLNRIIHPRVMRLVRQKLNEAEASGYTAAAVDGAALFEAGADRICDRTVFVTAPPEDRLKRILARDAVPEEAARLRMKAQKEDDYYASRADATVINRNQKQLSREIDQYLKEWFK